MFNKRFTIIFLLLMIGLIAVSSVSAEDSNSTADDLTQMMEVNDTVESNPAEDALESSNVIYFDASAASNGDGSKSKPFKYADSNTLGSYVGSGNNVTAYFADGNYDLNTNFKIQASSIVIVGESSEKTIFNSVLANKYDFEINADSYFELNNIKFNHANIINRGTIKANNVTFENCDAFYGNNAPTTYNTDKYDSSYGGAIICDTMGNLYTHVYLNNCIFNNTSAYAGGAVSLKNSNLIVKNSRFSNSKAKHVGGVIYAINSNLTIEDSLFSLNNASYGGVIYGESSIINLKNSNMTNSCSYSFGGAIGSKYCDIDVDGCNFKDYESSIDAGGAIYNFKGNINVKDSSFVEGYAEFGGAICILESNLTVLSSKFIDNDAGECGGSIYNIYGSIYLNNSFFNKSHAFEGGAIFCRYYDSLIFTNNIFLNCSGSDRIAIYTEGSNSSIVESGNHYENRYSVVVEYKGDLKGEEFNLRKVLNYVVSSTGTFLNSYGEMYSSDEDNEYLILTLNDFSYPDNSTIFINSSVSPYVEFNFRFVKAVLFNYRADYVVVTVYDDRGYSIYKHQYDIDQTQHDVNWGWKVRYDLDSSIKITGGAAYSFTANDPPVPLMDSDPSDLTDIPSYYDSRDYGYITPVKDQAEGGNCWAFAGLATLEACVKKITNVTYDLSEENAKNLMAMYSIMGLDINPNQGGYDSMLMGYLASWFGPVYDTTETYDDLSSLSGIYYSHLHVQNIYFVPHDSQSIKKAIMDYGAVSVSFYWLNAGYHAVSLVGWDDNYKGYDSVGYYAGNGAWIFKNSWGPEWEDNGFGYLSYSANFVNEIYTFTFDKTDNYAYNYQNEYSGVTDFIENDDGPIYYAAKFTIEYDDNYKYFGGVSTYFKYPTYYNISVYENFDDYEYHVYNKGGLVMSKSGFSPGGYHTIELSDSLQFFGGENVKLTVVVKCYNPGANYAPVCRADKLTAGDFKPDVSYISYDGENWFDLYNLEDYTHYLYGDLAENTCQVACIKLFASTSLKYSTHLSIREDDFDYVEVGEQITIEAKLEGEHYRFTKLIEDTMVTLNIDGKDYYAQFHNGTAHLNITFDRPGTHTLIPSYRNNIFKLVDLGQYVFTVNKKGAVISAKGLSKTYGGSEKASVTLKDSNGKPIANEVVIFDIGGKSTEFKTNEKGQASIPVNLAPNAYTATIRFAETEKYKSTTSKLNIVVKKATPKLTANKATFKVKKTKTYAVLLKDNKGKAINKAKVTLTVNGKTYKATTKNGKATFKITNLKKKGKFKATIKYAGDKYYNKVTKTVQITVK